MNKIKSNFIYATAYKMLEIMLPIITSPLLSRKLGADSLGTYSYTYSIAALFVMFAEMGSYRYGMREIAKVQKNGVSRNRVYSDIYWTHLITALVTLIFYLIFVLIIGKNLRGIFLLQSLCIVSNMISNLFLFVGMEDMKVVTLRDGAVKIITFILIVLLIKSPSDLITYILILNICDVFSKLITLVYAKKYVYLSRPNISNCVKHFKHMFVLMIPVLAAGIYQSMDKIMIGFLYSKSDIGYYECASKTLIFQNIITTLGVVFCPHITNLYSMGKKKEAERVFKVSFNLSIIISFAFMFGVSAIAEEFAPLFWGEGFEASAPLMIGISISLPLWTVGEVIRNQFLLPLGRDYEYMWAFVVGVIVNLIFNLLLIRPYGAMGAIFATIIAEFVMSAVQAFFVRKEIGITKELFQNIPYLFSGVFMYIIVREFALIWSGNKFIGLLLEVIVGVIVFLLLSFIYEVLSRKRLLLAVLKGQKNEFN